MIFFSKVVIALEKIKKMERTSQKYGNLGEEIANSLFLFSFDIVGLISSYLLCLSPHHPRTKATLICNNTMGSFLGCHAISISPDDHIWRVFDNGVCRYDLDGNYKPLKYEDKHKPTNDLERIKDIRTLFFTKDYIICEQLYQITFFCPSTYLVRHVLFECPRWLTIYGNDEIFMFNGSGYFSKQTFNGKYIGKKQFLRLLGKQTSRCVSMTCDSKGHLWLATGNGSVMVLEEKEGNELRCEELLQYVKRIHIDGFDNIYVIDPVLTKIHIYRATSNLFLNHIGEFDSGVQPIYLAFDRFHRIYVLDKFGSVNCWRFTEQ